MRPFFPSPVSQRSGRPSLSPIPCLDNPKVCLVRVLPSDTHNIVKASISHISIAYIRSTSSRPSAGTSLNERSNLFSPCLLDEGIGAYVRPIDRLRTTYPGTLLICVKLTQGIRYSLQRCETYMAEYGLKRRRS